MGKKEDKQVGQFFIDFPESLVSASHSAVTETEAEAAETINRMIRNKLLIYLWQDVQGVASMKAAVSLFDKSVNSYDDLYRKYGTDRVFSEAFINEFLIPNLESYPY